MNILKGIVTELRERRLWPVALALLAGLIAVPVLLSKSPSTPGSAPAPGGAMSGAGAQSVSVKLAGNAAQPALRGAAHDPFTQQPGTGVSLTSITPPPSVGGAVASVAAGGTASISAGGSSGGGSSAGASAGRSTGSGGGSTASGAGGSGSSTVSPGGAPAPSRGSAGKPGPRGLTPTQSYAVSLQTTNASGGLDLIDSLERLSPVPSQSRPLLVELGVLQGGQRVLFAVQPGTVPSGAGSCTPGPIDCEILSLGVNQTESVSVQVAGGLQPVAQFAVTGISAVNHPSVAAANQARNAASPVGAGLLEQSAQPALSLFQYQPSVGAVVDLRNLTVGGN